MDSPPLWASGGDLCARGSPPLLSRGVPAETSPAPRAKNNPWVSLGVIPTMSLRGLSHLRYPWQVVEVGDGINQAVHQLRIVRLCFLQLLALPSHFTQDGL